MGFTKKDFLMVPGIFLIIFIFMGYLFHHFETSQIEEAEQNSENLKGDLKGLGIVETDLKLVFVDSEQSKYIYTTEDWKLTVHLSKPSWYQRESLGETEPFMYYYKFDRI